MSDDPTTARVFTPPKFQNAHTATVELPEPDESEYDDDDPEPADRVTWTCDMHEISFWPKYQGEIQICYDGNYAEPLSVREARAFAAALIAAARHAEETP
jgi:hypothetical protein